MITRVYFLSGIKLKKNFFKHDLAWQYEMITRHYKVVGWIFLAYVTRIVSGHISHCAIGNESVVVEPLFNSIKTHAINDFNRTTDIITALEIKTPNQIEIESIQRNKLPGSYNLVWLQIWIYCWVRVFSYGYICPKESCVDLIKKALKTGGVVIPRRIYSPTQLHNYLIKRNKQ